MTLALLRPGHRAVHNARKLRGLERSVLSMRLMANRSRVPTFGDADHGFRAASRASNSRGSEHMGRHACERVTRPAGDRSARH
jgi:hypothetical protein